MFEVEQDFERVFDDLMRSPSFDVSNKTHATSVVLVAWVVETLSWRCIYQEVTRLLVRSNNACAKQQRRTKARFFVILPI